jgi:hypothetical protein
MQLNELAPSTYEVREYTNKAGVLRLAKNVTHSVQRGQKLVMDSVGR